MNNGITDRESLIVSGFNMGNEFGPTLRSGPYRDSEGRTIGM